MGKIIPTPPECKDVIIPMKYGPIVIDFRDLGKRALFVNCLAIEILCPISYKEWKETPEAKDFMKTCKGGFILEGGTYPVFWINCVVAVEYAKTSRYPISTFISEGINALTK
jgi:hypothetical protein